MKGHDTITSTSYESEILLECVLNVPALRALSE
jgi:hypothetical protein